MIKINNSSKKQNTDELKERRRLFQSIKPLFEKIKNKIYEKSIEKFQKDILHCILYTEKIQLKLLLKFAEMKMNKGNNKYIDAILKYRFKGSDATFLIIAMEYDYNKNNFAFNRLITLLDKSNLSLKDKEKYINSENIPGYTAILLANNEQLKKLISIGANINVETRNRQTPIRYFSKQRNKIDLLRLLIEHNANPFIIDTFGPTHILKSIGESPLNINVETREIQQLLNEYMTNRLEYHILKNMPKRQRLKVCRNQESFEAYFKSFYLANDCNTKSMAENILAA